MVDNCECEEFELDEKSQFCGYCDDAPTKHKRIGKRISQSKPRCIGNNNESTSENQPGTSHTPDVVETPRPINLSEVEHEPADEHETESEPNCQDEIAARSDDVERKGRTINPLSEVLKYVPTQKEKSPWKDRALGWIENPKRETGVFLQLYSSWFLQIILTSKSK